MPYVFRSLATWAAALLLVAAVAACGGGGDDDAKTADVGDSDIQATQQLLSTTDSNESAAAPIAATDNSAAGAEAHANSEFPCFTLDDPFAVAAALAQEDGSDPAASVDASPGD